MSRSHEYHPQRFQVPHDIREKIDNDLVMFQCGLGNPDRDNDLPEGVTRGNTDIYKVEGIDDIIVRLNHTNEPHAELKSVILSNAYEYLSAYGVNALPYNPIKHNDRIYVVTQKVDGVSLEDAMKTVSPEVLAPQIDQTWKGLVAYMADGYRHKTVVADDIVSPNQFMYGRVPGENEDKIWLVDLGTHASMYKLSNFMYEEMILTVAGHIVELEAELGTTLVGAREALAEAVSLPESVPRPLEEAEHYKHCILRATQYSLEKSVVIGYEEEGRILSL